MLWDPLLPDCMKSESVSTDLATRRAAGQPGIHSTPAPMQNPTLTDRDGPSPEKLMFLENSMRCSHAAMEPEVPSEQMRPAPTSCGIGKLIQLPETASRWAAHIVSRLSESRDVVCPLFTCFEPYLRSLKLELPNYFFIVSQYPHYPGSRFRSVRFENTRGSLPHRSITLRTSGAHRPQRQLIRTVKSGREQSVAYSETRVLVHPDLSENGAWPAENRISATLTCRIQSIIKSLATTQKNGNS